MVARAGVGRVRRYTDAGDVGILIELIARQRRPVDVPAPAGENLGRLANADRSSRFSLVPGARLDLVRWLGRGSGDGGQQSRLFAESTTERHMEIDTVDALVRLDAQQRA